MIDRFIEYWLGPVLLVLGVAAFLLGMGGVFDILPPPFSVPSGDFRRTLADDPVTFLAEMLSLGGMAIAGFGFSITQHFRKERRHSSTA